MNGDLQQVRTIARGYAAAHLLEQERLDGLADATLGTLAKRDLRMLADKEAKVAAEFGTVADLIDTATPLSRTGNFNRDTQWYLMGVSPADAGCWAPGNDLDDEDHPDIEATR